MSQKILLVKFSLEDGIPVDDTSENLTASYIPDDLYQWIIDKKLNRNIDIKETHGQFADVALSVVGNTQEVVNQIDAQLFDIIKMAHEHTSGILIKEEIEKDFRSLSILLKVRETLKAKSEQYADRPDILVVLG